MATSRATVGVISLGDMGAGVARMLIANGYKGVSNVSGRSEATQSRARSANITLASTDADLVSQCDYVLSIVPPRDARATAARIVEGYKSSKREASSPLYFLDLNAISPFTARGIADLFEDTEGIKVIDGGIIGGPPTQKEDGSWNAPSICLSGPTTLASHHKSGEHLASVLNTKHVGDAIGKASGLKCCFASLTKGAIALTIQSFTTASKLGVLDDLQEYIGHHGGPAKLETAKRGLTGMPPKAGRWVEEMREIGKTFSEDGGWAPEADIFWRVAEVFEFVAQSTELGGEHVDNRKRGRTVEDVVHAVGEGMEREKARALE